MALQIMKPIDEFLNTKIQDFKATPKFQSLLEDFNDLEEFKQTLFKSLITFITFMIPLSILLIVFIIHSNLSSKLEDTEAVIATGLRIIEKKENLALENKNVLGPKIQSQGDLNNAIMRAANSSGAEAKNFKISNFSLDESKGFLIAKADIQFSDLSNKDFFDFLKLLNTNTKIRVEEIDIKKNPQSNFLEGIVSITQYSMAQN